MGYISDYLEFTSNTECPLVFHQWSCLSSLSVLAGRRFWFKLGPYTYYPNLYVVLVGHPGVKKSSAMDRAKDLVRAINASGVARIPVAAAQATKEFIAKAMSNEKFPGKRFFKHGDSMEEYNQYAIFATELTQFIGVNPIGMLDFLTTVYTEKVYDCDTKGQGSDLVVGPYITLLACLTPEMLKGFLKQNILTGGFARRTVFVYGTGGSVIPFPEFTTAQAAAQARCVARGKDMQSLSGEFVFSLEAREWYEKWYRDLNFRLTEVSTPATEGWYKTKHEILFKICMLISLSEGDTNVIEVSHLELAEKRFLVPIERHLDRVFEGAGINPNAGAAAQICRMLEALDRPMNKKHVEALFFDQATSLSELRDTIVHLCNVGRLATRNIMFNGQLLGEVIGTPQAVKRCSDSEMAVLLTTPVVPPPETSSDQSS